MAISKFKIQNLNRFAGGFTLVELLVVVSIIGILLGIAIFGLQGSRESARDAKRKSDIELVRAGLELYKSDCKRYPNSSGFDLFSQTQLAGDDSTTSCTSANTYITAVPKDPNDPERIYKYSSNGVTYELCSALEVEEGTVVYNTCAGSTGCGGTNSCRLRATNP